MLAPVRVHTCDSIPTGRKCRAQSGRDAGHQNAFGPQMAEAMCGHERGSVSDNRSRLHTSGRVVVGKAFAKPWLFVQNIHREGLILDRLSCRGLHRGRAYVRSGRHQSRAGGRISRPSCRLGHGDVRATAGCEFIVPNQSLPRTWSLNSRMCWRRAFG